MSGNRSDIVRLNVGGQLFTTTRDTLCRYSDSVLSVLVSNNENCKLFIESSVKATEGGCNCASTIFIDCDGSLFHHVLNFLRFNQYPPSHLHNDIYHVANFLNIKPLVAYLEAQPAIATRIILRRHKDMIPRFDEIKNAVLSAAKENALRHHLYQLSPTAACRLYLSDDVPPRRCGEHCLVSLLDVVFDNYIFPQVYNTLLSISQFLRDDFASKGYKVRLSAEQCVEHSVGGSPPLNIAVFQFEFPKSSADAIYDD